MEKLKLQAIEDNLSKVTDWVETFLRQETAEEKSISEFLIAVDELFINVCHYAYGEKIGEVEFALEMREEPKRVRLVMKDRGIAFDPYSREDPDITLSAEERKIGGLGIFMVKDFMDHVDYEYRESQNIITLEKELG